MAPQGSAFTQGLRTDYFALADRQKAEGDLTDNMHFTRKQWPRPRASTCSPTW